MLVLSSQGHFRGRILMTSGFICRFLTSFTLLVDSLWSLCTFTSRYNHHKEQIDGRRLPRFYQWRNITHQNRLLSIPSSVLESCHHGRCLLSHGIRRIMLDRWLGKMPCQMNILLWQICSVRLCCLHQFLAPWTSMELTIQVPCFQWSMELTTLWTFHLKKTQFPTIQ